MLVCQWILNPLRQIFWRLAFMVTSFDPHVLASKVGLEIVDPIEAAPGILHEYEPSPEAGCSIPHQDDGPPYLALQCPVASRHKRTVMLIQLLPMLGVLPGEFQSRGSQPAHPPTTKHSPAPRWALGFGPQGTPTGIGETCGLVLLFIERQHILLYLRGCAPWQALRVVSKGPKAFFPVSLGLPYSFEPSIPRYTGSSFSLSLANTDQA